MILKWKINIFYESYGQYYIVDYINIFTFSSWMRRYWLFEKNDFQNFHQISTFWSPMSKNKERFLQKCLSVVVADRIPDVVNNHFPTFFIIN